MKGSDIIHLRPGVYQLEGGCRDWNTAKTEAVLIDFGGIQTELVAKQVEGDAQVFLPVVLEDASLETICVSHKGTYLDGGGQEHEIPDLVFDILMKLRIGQKILIQDAEASTVYVVKLLDVAKWG